MAAPPVRATWLHRTETSPAAGEVNAVLRLAAAGAKLTTLSQWRLLQIGILGAASSLGPAPPIAEETANGTELVIRVAKSPNLQHQEWQNALMRGLLALQLTQPGGGLATLPTSFNGSWLIQTEGGEPAAIERFPGPETGALPLVVGIVLVVIAAGAIAAGMLWDAQQAEVQVRKIEADSKQKTLQQNLAAAAGIIDKHQAREAAQGSTIPYDEAELLLLGKLNQSIGEVTGWKPTPLQTVPDVRELSRETGKAIEKVGEGAKTGTTIMLLVGAYLLLEGN